MKTSILIVACLALTVVSYGQRIVYNDPSYSAYNYKHPNKAAYAKWFYLDRPASLKQIEVVQIDNYKRSNMTVRSKKMGTITRNDRNKKYPNYKHQVQ